MIGLAYAFVEQSVNPFQANTLIFKLHVNTPFHTCRTGQFSSDQQSNIDRLNGQNYVFCNARFTTSCPIFTTVLLFTRESVKYKTGTGFSYLTIRLDVCEEKRVNPCEKRQKQTRVHINQIFQRVNVGAIHKVLSIL